MRVHTPRALRSATGAGRLGLDWGWRGGVCSGARGECQVGVGRDRRVGTHPRAVVTSSLFLSRFTRFTYSYDFKKMLFGCTLLACDAFSLCSRIRATSAFSSVLELAKSGCGDRRVTQRVSRTSGMMVQQHTGPQLQLLCVFIVLHGRCHTSHLGPSLAAVAVRAALRAAVRTASPPLACLEGV